ncbi:hypothetical protein DL771_004693 [Monosporascus sp. 5C6A]|nr:hypothetical protein DL771_004693 [Monosporascus sp. 5C6A]
MASVWVRLKYIREARLASGPAAAPNAWTPSEANSGLSAPAGSFTAESATVNLDLYARRCLHAPSRSYFMLGGRLGPPWGVHVTPPSPKSTQSRAKAGPDTPPTGRSHTASQSSSIEWRCYQAPLLGIPK